MERPVVLEFDRQIAEQLERELPHISSHRSRIQHAATEWIRDRQAERKSEQQNSNEQSAAA